jgi:hypothetical protein
LFGCCLTSSLATFFTFSVRTLPKYSLASIPKPCLIYLAINVPFPVPFITCVLTAFMKSDSFPFNAISKANLVYALFHNAGITENKMDKKGLIFNIEQVPTLSVSEKVKW